MRLAVSWVTGSPHSAIDAGRLSEIPANGQIEVDSDQDQVKVATASTDAYSIGGLRYRKTEDFLEWTTSIVSLRLPDKHLLSIQVVCEALSTAGRLPPPRKPYFIRQALEVLGGGSDGQIPVTDKPFHLDEGEETIAAALITGTAGNSLPIVYVSAPFHGSSLVEPGGLAKFVGGMAHVVVEPSRRFASQLRTLTDGRNVFGGTVGVYWPKTNAKKSYYFDGQFRDSRALQLEIAKDIRIALSNRRLQTRCTWAHLTEVVARKKLEQLQTEGSTGLDDYIKAFDAELAAKQSRLEEAEAEIARLSSELRKAAGSARGGGRLLRAGTEQDLYPSETEDIIHEALSNAQRNAYPNGRKVHVLSDLLAANPIASTKQQLADEVKAILRDYKDMDARKRGALEELGFEISEEGKHYKAVFRGDGRYTFSISKTSSDHRAGLNLASDINKTLF